MAKLAKLGELPVELWSKIFRCTLPRDGRVHPSPKAAPLLLAQICRQWRAVALATPELWSSIFLEIFPDSSYAELAFGQDIPLDPTTALVDLWFGRSSEYPLSITIRCPKPGVRLPYGLMKVLKNRCTKWERLEMVLSVADLLELNTVSGPFPCLRILAIGSNKANQPVHLLHYSGALHIPNSSYLWVHLFQPELPLTRLTTLELSMENPALVVPVFDLLPQLNHLIFSSYCFGPCPIPPPVPVTAHIRCLVLRRSPAFLYYVALPSLEHLVVFISDEEASKAVVSLVARSRCRLTSLALRHSSLPPAAWSALLPVAGIVPTLELTNMWFNPRVLLRAQPPLPCARLQILPRRMKGGGPIPRPDRSVAAGLRRLAAKGMRITVETPTYRWPEEPTRDLDGATSLLNPERPIPPLLDDVYDGLCHLHETLRISTADQVLFGSSPALTPTLCRLTAAHADSLHPALGARRCPGDRVGACIFLSPQDESPFAQSQVDAHSSGQTLRDDVIPPTPDPDVDHNTALAPPRRLSPFRVAASSFLFRHGPQCDDDSGSLDASSHPHEPGRVQASSHRHWRLRVVCITWMMERWGGVRPLRAIIVGIGRRRDAPAMMSGGEGSSRPAQSRRRALLRLLGSDVLPSIALLLKNSPRLVLLARVLRLPSAPAHHPASPASSPRRFTPGARACEAVDARVGRDLICGQHRGRGAQYQCTFARLRTHATCAGTGTPFTLLHEHLPPPPDPRAPLQVGVLAVSFGGVPPARSATMRSGSLRSRAAHGGWRMRGAVCKRARRHAVLVGGEARATDDEGTPEPAHVAAGGGCAGAPRCFALAREQGYSARRASRVRGAGMRHPPGRAARAARHTGSGSRAALLATRWRVEIQLALAVRRDGSGS
ncbi:hypothetical protein B0H13DRAFT_2570200 [Mycena leptocephala]|nr:hypothetical protein B0H13DRAFT_2570200 [Mycena leptocephala]